MPATALLTLNASCCLLCSQNKSIAGKKKTLADYAIIRRIHFIFERAVRKFKSDLSLWTSWLEFCRASNSNRRLGRVVGRALQIHPTEPGLWVYAAAWEFEHNQNPAAARALMQQGLRMCKYSEKMWLDYFDMVSCIVEQLYCLSLRLLHHRMKHSIFFAAQSSDAFSSW